MHILKLKVINLGNCLLNSRQDKNQNINIYGNLSFPYFSVRFNIAKMVTA